MSNFQSQALRDFQESNKANLLERVATKVVAVLVFPLPLVTLLTFALN